MTIPTLPKISPTHPNSATFARAKRTQQLYPAQSSSVSSRVSAASTMVLPTIPRASIENPLAALTRFPAVISKIVLDYSDPITLQELVGCAEGRTLVSRHFDETEDKQKKTLHALRSDIHAINLAIQEAAKFSLVRSDSKNRLWEVAKTSLDSPRKTSTTEKKANAQIKEIQEKLKYNEELRHKISVPRPKLSLSEIDHLIQLKKARPAAAAAALPSHSSLLLAEELELEKKLLKLEAKAPSYTFSRSYQIEKTAKEIDNLYYSTLFNVRYLYAHSEPVKMRLDKLNKDAHIPLLSKALSEEDRVAYAAVGTRHPNTPNTPNLLLLSPGTSSSIRKYPMGDLLNAHEGEVVLSSDQEGPLFIIPNHAKVARLVNSPALAAVDTFERAVSDNG